MKKFLAVLIALCVCFSLAGCGAEQTVYRRSEVVLGDGIVLDVKAKGKGAKNCVDEMFALSGSVFNEINLSLPSSMLSRFNNGSSGEEFEISKYTYEMLTLAKSVYEETQGAFDVTSLPLVKLWKTDAANISSLRPDINDLTRVLADSLPSMEQVERTKAVCGMDKIIFREDGGKYFLEKTVDGAQVDLGGIAKGYFTDLCNEIAQKHNVVSCLINLSGNLYLYGKGIQGGANWTVGVLNPRPRLAIDEAFRGYIAAISCEGDRAIVSSGDYQRFYYYSYLPPSDLKSEAQLIAVPHIIDVAAGLPIGVKYDEQNLTYYNDFSNVCMATVSSLNSAKCDAYATAVCVLGIEKGADLLTRMGYDGIILTNPDLPYADENGSEIVGTKQGKGEMAVIGNIYLMEEYSLYKRNYTPYGQDAW